MYFRRLHSFALTLGWLQWPILGCWPWPSQKYKAKRGITWEEHRLLVDSEKDAEWKSLLELAWHVGAAQIDLVSLAAENIDRNTKTITYFRRKTNKPCLLRFGDEVAAILKRLPASGPLFPISSALSSADIPVALLRPHLGRPIARRVIPVTHYARHARIDALVTEDEHCATTFITVSAFKERRSLKAAAAKTMVFGGRGNSLRGRQSRRVSSLRCRAIYLW